MKTELIPAEEWQDKEIVGDCSLVERAINIEVLRKAQLNAAKWGMEKAAEIAYSQSTGPMAYSAILTAANKLELPK